MLRRFGVSLLGRTPLYFALALCLVAPGCVDVGAPATPAGGPASTARLLAGLAQEPLLVGKGSFAETSLAVAGDVVLACAHGNFAKPSPLWASVDGGRTFAAQDPQPNPLPSGDCDVIVMDDGTWAIVYDTVASATVATSPDKGATWSINLLSAVPFGGVDRPWLLALGNDILLVYADVMTVQPSIVMATRSSDGGHTWSEPALVTRMQDAARFHTVIGHPFVDGDGAIRVPLDSYAPQQPAGDHFLEMAVSRDGGATWTREPVAGPLPLHLALPSATSSGGWLHVAYAQREGSLADVRVVSSRDGGATWSEPLAIADDVPFAGLASVWIDGAGDGAATLAWHGRPAEGAADAWQPTAARLEIGLAGAPTLVGAAPVGRVAEGAMTYEFLMVRHDARGVPLVLYPAPGEDCGGDLRSSRLSCVLLARGGDEPPTEGPGNGVGGARRETSTIARSLSW